MEMLIKMKREYSIDLHIRIPISLDQNIETYCNDQNKRNKTEGIKQLIQIGLFIVEKWELLKKEPNRLEELYQQLKEGELVDSIQKISSRDLEIMFDIFKTEYSARSKSMSKDGHLRLKN